MLPKVPEAVSQLVGIDLPYPADKYTENFYKKYLVSVTDIDLFVTVSIFVLYVKCLLISKLPTDRLVFQTQI